MSLKIKRYLYALWFCMAAFIIFVEIMQIGINLAKADEEVVVEEIAEEAEEQTEIQIIDIKMLEPVYTPIDGDIRPLTNAMENYTNEDVEILARLLWSSPLATESEKVKMVWLVLNRINSRNSTWSKMTSTETAVTVNEFPYFDKRAHLSDTNLNIVRTVLESYNLWFSGEDIGEHPSAQGVYCSFSGNNNERITLFDYNWEVVE